MPLTEFKKKAASLALIVTTIGAGVTLIGYLTPVVDYVSSINSLVKERQQIINDIDSLKTHVREYEAYRANKKGSFAIGLRGNISGSQLVYVNERNGIYRAFLDDHTGRYFYYDDQGKPIYCYSQEAVDTDDHDDDDFNRNIQPIVAPTISISDTSN